jgi:hypothetical protein
VTFIVINVCTLFIIQFRFLNLRPNDACSDELIKLIDRCFFVFSYFPVFVIQKWIIRADYLPDNPMDTPGFNLLRP